MLPDYKDITSRIADPVQWWDSNGVPRYNKFDPEDVPCIYADEVILFVVQCQNCYREFLVGDYSDRRTPMDKTIYARVQDRTLHYGDPPYHVCLGDSMNSVPLRVVEYWIKWSLRWKRLDVVEKANIVPDWWTKRT